MSYGIYSLNDAGSVLLTDFLLSYTLVSVQTIVSGTNIFSADINASSRSTATFSYTGVQPIVAYRCDTAAITVYQNVKTAENNWTANIQVGAAPGVTIYAYIFEATTLASSGGFGFDIYNSSAERIYTVSAKPMRIVGVATAPGSYTSYPTGTYAVASSVFTFQYSVTDTGRTGSLRYINYWYSYGTYITANGPTINNMIVRQYTSASPGYVARSYGPEFKLIIDVTGY